MHQPIGPFTMLVYRPAMRGAQVASLGVPYMLMHMRGDPTTMQQPQHTTYADTCADVGRELQAAAHNALAAGIEPWSLILDPGGLLLLPHHPVSDCFSSLPFPSWLSLQ